MFLLTCVCEHFFDLIAKTNIMTFALATKYVCFSDRRPYIRGIIPIELFCSKYFYITSVGSIQGSFIPIFHFEWGGGGARGQILSEIEMIETASQLQSRLLWQR